MSVFVLLYQLYQKSKKIEYLPARLHHLCHELHPACGHDPQYPTCSFQVLAAVP
jgi:hypothetical protein